LLLSIFPDLQRAFRNQNTSRKKNKRFLLSLFDFVDQMNRMGRAVPEPILLALFLTSLLRVLIPEHPFLGERE
jgi:hypothetical protein